MAHRDDNPYNIAISLQKLEESKAEHGLASTETYRAARDLGQALSHNSSVDEELNLYTSLQNMVEEYAASSPSAKNRSYIVRYTFAQGLAYHAKEMWFPCIEILEEGFVRLASLHETNSYERLYKIGNFVGVVDHLVEAYRKTGRLDDAILLAEETYASTQELLPSTYDIEGARWQRLLIGETLWNLYRENDESYKARQLCQQGIQEAATGRFGASSHDAETWQRKLDALGPEEDD